MPKLKVFRTAIGFHDAYVAAPSRAAALRAWGADSELFAMGAAEIVTDAETAAPALAEPGVVIRVSRGSKADHMSEFERSDKSGGRTKAGRKPDSAVPRPPNPRPSRQDLEKAAAELKAAEGAHGKVLNALDRRIAKLRRERDAANQAFEQERAGLARRRDEAQSDYEAALESGVKRTADRIAA